jgi:hypothetical protein
MDVDAGHQKQRAQNHSQKNLHDKPSDDAGQRRQGEMVPCRGNQAGDCEGLHIIVRREAISEFPR